MAVLGGQGTYLDSGSAVVISGAFAVSAFRCSGLLCAVMANKGKGPAPRCSVPGGDVSFPRMAKSAIRLPPIPIGPSWDFGPGV